jgi:hypothetical protein
MTVGIDTRRTDLCNALTAALTAATIPDVQVCDDEPAVLAADRSIVVTWVSSRHDAVQWLHTYEAVVIVTLQDRAAFFTERDRLTGLVLDTLNRLDGTSGRPTASTRTIELGAGEDARTYPLCSVVAVVATAQPTRT